MTWKYEIPTCGQNEQLNFFFFSWHKTNNFGVEEIKQLVFTFFFHFFRDGIGVLFMMKKTFAANSNTFTLSHTLFGTLRDINPYQFNLLAWLEIEIIFE